MTALITATMILRSFRTINTILKAILVIVGALLILTSEAAYFGIGIGLVIYFFGQAMNSFIGNERDLRFRTFVLILLLVISLELIVLALVNKEIWRPIL